MATSSRGEHLRYRYGICLNDSCSKCKSKEVQQIAARKDFVCAECGKNLRECPPPKQGLNMKLIGGVAAAVVVIGGGIAALTLGGGDKTETPVETVDTLKTDSIQGGQQQGGNEQGQQAGQDKGQQTDKGQTKEPRPDGGNNGGSGNYGSVKTPYGKYTGDLKNGQPHGHGKLTFTKPYTIGENEAQPGDTYEGEFRDGRISGGPGYWGHDGDVTFVNP